jgi:hypothetical protein
MAKPEIPTPQVEDSAGSVVGLATILIAGRFGVQISVVAREFYLLLDVHIDCGAHPTS